MITSAIYYLAKKVMLRAHVVASGPDIGSPEYHDLRSNAPLVESNVPSGTKYNHLHEVESKDSYRTFSRSYDLNLSQSPRAHSLSSRVKTGGKTNSYHQLEKGGYYVSKRRSWKKGHNPCSKGYKIQRINNAWWCVKQ